MARIRSIKPEFWSSEQIIECSPTARLLFIGLWNFCDDAGRHTYSPKSIMAQVFPGDSFTTDDIRRMIDELSTNDLIRIYEFDGKQYLYVTGWSKHQRIDKPRQSVYPDPAFSPFVEHSSNDRRPLATDPILSDQREPYLLTQSTTPSNGSAGRKPEAASSAVPIPVSDALASKYRAKPEPIDLEIPAVLRRTA